MIWTNFTNHLCQYPQEKVAIKYDGSHRVAVLLAIRQSDYNNKANDGANISVENSYISASICIMFCPVYYT